LATLRRLGPIANELEEDLRSPVQYANDMLDLDIEDQAEEDEDQEQARTEGSMSTSGDSSSTERVLTLAEFQEALMSDEYHQSHQSSETESKTESEPERKDSATEADSDTIPDSGVSESSMNPSIPFTNEQRASLLSRQLPSPPRSLPPSRDFPYGYRHAKGKRSLSNIYNRRAKKAADQIERLGGQARKPLKKKARQLTAFG